MSSKAAILDAIRKNRPAQSPLPDIPRFGDTPDDLVTVFVAACESAAARAFVLDAGKSSAEVIREAYPEARLIASHVAEVDGNVDLAAVIDPHQLDGVDLFVCRGEIGVAENGAIWLPESQMAHRVAPFIAQHVAIILNRHDIVSDMHAAYARIQVDRDGFGLFVAGPSKTADIEQSLVIGAHGPRSLAVVLV